MFGSTTQSLVSAHTTHSRQHGLEAANPGIAMTSVEGKRTEAVRVVFEVERGQTGDKLESVVERRRSVTALWQLNVQEHNLKLR